MQPAARLMSAASPARHAAALSAAATASRAAALPGACLDPQQGDRQGKLVGVDVLDDRRLVAVGDAESAQPDHDVLEHVAAGVVAELLQHVGAALLRCLCRRGDGGGGPLPGQDRAQPAPQAPVRPVGPGQVNRFYALLFLLLGVAAEGGMGLEPGHGVLLEPVPGAEHDVADHDLVLVALGDEPDPPGRPGVQVKQARCGSWVPCGAQRFAFPRRLVAVG